MITDEAFKAYGQVITEGYDVTELIEALDQKNAPEDDVVYVASEASFEGLAIAKDMEERFFGGMPIQVGYCNGTNGALNALEYHRNTELSVAATDLILLVGKQQDLKDFTYDTSKVEAFLVKRGQMFELYATTLHYAPCSVEGKPFRNIVVLPKGTNTDLKVIPGKQGEDQLLVATNKWLVAHEEAGIEGAFVGLIGENIKIQ